MTSASTRALLPDLKEQFVPVHVRGGAQSLLIPERTRSSSYLVQGIAVAAYVLALFAVANLTLRSSDPLEEEPLELVMLPSAPELPEVDEAPPVEEPIEEESPPPVAEQPELVEPPPPPVAEEPEPSAPVERKLPLPEKKPTAAKKKRNPVKKNVAKKPPVHQNTRPAPVTAPGPARVAPSAPTAIPSGYANQIFARVSRTASTASARAAIARGQSGRIRYRLVIAPNGALISKSITPSGNPTFDGAAAAALSRAAPFPPTGMPRPISLSGAIVYR